MIQEFTVDKKNDYLYCRSSGCSCCSCDYDIQTCKEEILNEARDNIRVVKEICEYYKIDFSEYCKDILTKKQCKKHKFYKKYSTSDMEQCRMCNKIKTVKEK